MQTPQPLVSVVIPTCDRRGVLSRCVAALAEQTYEAYEVIVVDDNSADGTIEMLEDAASRYPRMTLRWLRNDTHRGANPSRNRGIRAAEGELIAFLDSDCIAQPDWIERLVAGFTSSSVAAVTGLVLDPPPTNVYELCFKGTHRLSQEGPAHRLVAGNMCVRRGLLMRFPLDQDLAESPSERAGKRQTKEPAGCDEEGLYLMLVAAGFEVRAMPSAVVLHDHPMDRRSLLRQAWRGGRSAARFVYKYYLPPRVDVVPFLLAYLTLPLCLLDLRWLASPAFFGAIAIAALLYNDLFRKGKSLLETAKTLPILLMYYHLRVAGYAVESFRCRSGHGPVRVRPSEAVRAAARRPAESAHV